MFVHAGPGTVFLDEIGELPLGTQAKLLRAIEQKEVFPVGAEEPVKVEARILAATNKDLRAEVAAGRFREDLFYRFNVVSVSLPPLRERREDIPDLVDDLLARHARAVGRKFTGVSHEALQLLLAHPWRGNVRELDNALQRAVILGEGPLVLPGDLPPDVRPVTDDPFAIDELGRAVERFEKLHIERILPADPRQARGGPPAGHRPEFAVPQDRAVWRAAVRAGVATPWRRHSPAVPRSPGAPPRRSSPPPGPARRVPCGCARSRSSW